MNTAGLPDAQPAARTFIPVRDDSYRLQDELAESGLQSRTLLASIGALAHQLRLAGTTAEREERRRELDLHLSYWTAVKRVVLASWEKPPAIESYEPRIRRLEPSSLLVSRATSGAGLSQYEVVEVGSSGLQRRFPRFLVEGCRLVGGDLTGLQADEVSLYESGLFGLEFSDFDVDSLDGRYVAALKSAISGTVRVLNLSDTAMRDADLTLTVMESATFQRADLSARARLDFDDLREMARLTPWSPNDAAARFTNCNFESVSFRDAVLHDTRFTNCDLGTAVFVDAYVHGAQFQSCMSHGRPLTRSDLKGAFGAEAAVIS